MDSKPEMPIDRISQHKSVLFDEVSQIFDKHEGITFVDCTLGGGGHLRELMKRKPQAKFIAIDLDPAMLDRARQNFAPEIQAGKLVLLHGNYANIRSLLHGIGISAVDGILLDAGVSSFQLDQAERGFSFMNEGPLDMRMDTTQPVSAYEVVNQWATSELEKIFFQYGEEKFSRRIAQRITEKRSQDPIRTTKQLGEIVEAAIPAQFRYASKIHPATRVFQAIRIAVNDELGGLAAFLKEIPGILNPGGLVAVITFHSLEDRPVKEHFRFLSDRCICPPEIITCGRCGNPEGSIPFRKPMIAQEAEISDNPRARSAKLRVFQKKAKPL